MALQITLVKAPKAVSIAKTSHIFDKRGGTLGRSDSNLWVLPDLEKFLSSCHCEVLYESGAYFLLDLSTNGTFINSAFEPIGKGSKVPIKHGDVFDIGEYRFSLELTDDQPFGYAAPQSSASLQPESPFSSDFFAAGDRNPVNPIPYTASPDFVVSDFSSGLAESQDPLAAFDKAGKSNNNGIFGQAASYAVFNSTIERHSPVGTGVVDMSPSIDQAISWPSSSQESLIPEDWEDDLLGSSAGRNPFGGSDPFDSLAVEAHAPIHSPIFEMPEAAPMQQKSEDLSRISPASIPMPMPNIPRPANTLAARIAEMPVAPEVKTKPVAVPVAEAIAPLKPSTGSNSTLIVSMGLNPDLLTSDEVDGISESVGLLMREITEGMMQVLRSRTSIKNEFRMNVTTIQPIENNPLKFSVGVDEALENMFVKKTNAYKKPVDAFREGFQEIGEHQVAMIAGIRHGFERMIERFNPDNLELQFNKQGKGGVIPGMQKAKHWTNYKDHYQSYSDNMESSFQHLFGSDFVSAYEDQLRKLTSQRKKNK